MIKTQPFPSLWDRLLKNSLKKNTLLELHFELTYRCNLQCEYCYLPRNPSSEELSTSQVFSILDDLKRMNTLWIYFTGGEVFTRGDITEILLYAKSKGFMISISTNGTLITPQLCKLLKDLSIHLNVSLKSATPENYEKITRSPSAWEQVLNTLDLLKSYEIPFTITFLVTRRNYREFLLARQIAKKYSARFTFSYIIRPKWEGEKDIQKFQIPPSKILKLLHTYHREIIGEERERKPISHPSSAINLFYCRAGKSLAAINPYGEMKPCIALLYPSYNLKEIPISEAWNRLVDFIHSIKPSKDWYCPNCPWESFCFRCPAESWLYNHKFDSCPPWCRELAKGLAIEWENRYAKKSPLSGI